MYELEDNTFTAIVQVLLNVCYVIVGFVLPLCWLISYTFLGHVKREIRSAIPVVSEVYLLCGFLFGTMILFIISMDTASFDSFNQHPKKPYHYQWYNLNDVIRFPFDNICIANSKIYPLRINFSEEKKDTPPPAAVKRNYIILVDKTASANADEPIPPRIIEQMNKRISRNGCQMPVNNKDLVNGKMTDLYAMELLNLLYTLQNDSIRFQIIYYFGGNSSKGMLDAGKSNEPAITSKDNLYEMRGRFLENLNALTNEQGGPTDIAKMIAIASRPENYVEEAENHILILSDFEDLSQEPFNSKKNKVHFTALNKTTHLALVQLELKEGRKKNGVPPEILNSLRQHIVHPLKQFHAEHDSLPRMWLSPPASDAEEGVFLFFPYTDNHQRPFAMGKIQFVQPDSCRTELVITHNDQLDTVTGKFKMTINNGITFEPDQIFTVPPTLTGPITLSVYAENYQLLDMQYFLTVYQYRHCHTYAKRYPLHLVKMPYTAVDYSLAVIYYLLLLLLGGNFFFYFIVARRMLRITREPDKTDKSNKTDKPKNNSGNTPYEKAIKRRKRSLYALAAIAVCIMLLTVLPLVLYLLIAAPPISGNGCELLICLIVLFIFQVARIVYFFRYSDVNAIAGRVLINIRAAYDRWPPHPPA